MYPLKDASILLFGTWWYTLDD